jgi:hypothetical protein
MSKPSFIHVTYIKSTPEKVWQALTEARRQGDIGATVEMRPIGR